MVSDEQLFAWLDGELGEDEARRVEAAVAADPRLSALADEHRAMQARLTTAFATIAEAPVPDRLLAAARPQPSNVVDLPTGRREPSVVRGPAVQWAAMAATLALGIFVGTMVPRQGGAPIEVAGSNIYAAAALDRALDTQLASAPSTAADVRIGMTFRDQSGRVCRTFTEARQSGLACREGERWQMRGLFAAPEGQSSEFRMAAGMDPNLAALVDSTIHGDAFDAAQEKAAREKGWR
jgi:hypothetical protein